MVEQLGIPENTHVWADRKQAIQKYNGLNALQWDFGITEFIGDHRDWPLLNSGGKPYHFFFPPLGGALLGRRLSTDKMVESFKPKIS